MKGLVISSGLLFFTIMGCVSQQKLTQVPPFKITNPIFRMVISGQEASPNQLELRMGWQVEEGQKVVPDTLYFKDKATLSFLETTPEGAILVGRFTMDKQAKGDFIMHANPLKEIGNQPTLALPTTKTDSFDMADTEAILSYRKWGKKGRYYFKITGIVEKQPLIMPSRPH